MTICINSDLRQAIEKLFVAVNGASGKLYITQTELADALSSDIIIDSVRAQIAATTGINTAGEEATFHGE